MATSGTEPFWHHVHDNGWTSLVVQHPEGLYSWGAVVGPKTDALCRHARSLEAAMIAADTEVTAKTGHHCTGCKPWIGW